MNRLSFGRLPCWGLSVLKRLSEFESDKRFIFGIGCSTTLYVSEFVSIFYCSLFKWRFLLINSGT